MKDYEKTTFKVNVLAQDEDGSRDLIGEGFYSAETELEANKLARDEHWDERLTGHYLCAFSTTEVEDGLCEFCEEAEAEGECGECDAPVCESCSCAGACCDGPR